MFDPLTGLAIGGGVGLLKHFAVDKPRENRKRALAAATARYRPWTGLTPDDVQEADPFSNALAFGATGAKMGMDGQTMEANNALREAMAARMNPWADPRLLLMDDMNALDVGRIA